MSEEWHRFSEVTQYVPAGRHLFRSSAPNYDGEDSSQRLTQTAVDFLVKKGINSIISFNQFSYGEDLITSLLEPAHIAYRHLPVNDFQAPTLDQLKGA